MSAGNEDLISRIRGLIDTEKEYKEYIAKREAEIPARLRAAEAQLDRADREVLLPAIAELQAIFKELGVHSDQVRTIEPSLHELNVTAAGDHGGMKIVFYAALRPEGAFVSALNKGSLADLRDNRVLIEGYPQVHVGWLTKERMVKAVLEEYEKTLRRNEKGR